MRSLACRAFFTMLLVIVCIGARAQDRKTQPPKPLVVGVIVNSNYARITDFLPILRNSVVKAIPHRLKQVRAVALNVSPQDAAETARSKGCDYLLRLSVEEARGAGVNFSTHQFTSERSPDEERERRELDWVLFDYHLQSLNDHGVDVSDSDHVRFAERPSAWDNTAFQTTVIRAATRVAVSTLNNNLPKK